MLFSVMRKGRCFEDVAVWKRWQRGLGLVMVLLPMVKPMVGWFGLEAGFGGFEAWLGEVQGGMAAVIVWIEVGGDAGLGFAERGEVDVDSTMGMDLSSFNRPKPRDFSRDEGWDEVESGRDCGGEGRDERGGSDD